MKLSEMKSFFWQCRSVDEWKWKSEIFGTKFKIKNSMKSSKFPSNVPDAASTISHKFPTFKPMSLKNWNENRLCVKNAFQNN